MAIISTTRASYNRPFQGGHQTYKPKPVRTAEEAKYLAQIMSTASKALQSHSPTTLGYNISEIHRLANKLTARLKK